MSTRALDITYKLDTCLLSSKNKRNHPITDNNH